MNERNATVGEVARNAGSASEMSTSTRDKAERGGAGRGFAVVADEVRNLTEKTMASPTDVGNAIKAIQDRKNA